MQHGLSWGNGSAHESKSPQNCGDESAETLVKVGGFLSNHKGINLPNTILDISSLTQKDINDLKFGLQLGVDWVGLSFVQRPEDIAEAQKIISGRAYIMAKIEKPQAVDNIDDILESIYKSSKQI